MQVLDGIKLDFDDVLIRPCRSEAPSRQSIEINRKFTFLHSTITWEGLPLIASNMSIIGTLEIAKVMASQHALTCLHKYYEIEKLRDFFTCRDELMKKYVFYTLGIKDEDFDKLKNVLDVCGPLYLINIDAANGNTKYFVDKVKQVKDLLPRSVIMAGNVCTPEMVQELLISGGASIIKCGIGGGSACCTRTVAGIGVPQLSCVIECANAAHGLRGHICSDGGCKNSGDIVKAYGAGADFVMCGGLFAGHDECDGEWEETGEVNWNNNIPICTGKMVKKSMKFFGMASDEAMRKYGQKTSYRALEGKCVQVPYKGPLINTIQEITGGIRSACTYVGASQLKDFSKCCTFVRVNKTHNTVFGSY